MDMAAAKGKGEEKRVVKVYDSEEELAVSLAKYTAEISKKFTAERGAFTVVLSGGSLIKSLRLGFRLTPFSFPCLHLSFVFPKFVWLLRKYN